MEHIVSWSAMPNNRLHEKNFSLVKVGRGSGDITAAGLPWCLGLVMTDDLVMEQWQEDSLDRTGWDCTDSHRHQHHYLPNLPLPTYVHYSLVTFYSQTQVWFYINKCSIVHCVCFFNCFNNLVCPAAVIALELALGPGTNASIWILEINFNLIITCQICHY